MAQIEIGAEHNLPTISELAGGEERWTTYRAGVLHVENVTQEALEDARDVYLADLETYLLVSYRTRRKAKIAALSAEFIGERYPSFRRELFIALAEEARNSGLTNRAAYINQMLTWVKTVVVGVLVAEDTIDSYDTVEEIRSVVLDTESFVATDPEVTVRGAMAIED